MVEFAVNEYRERKVLAAWASLERVNLWEVSNNDLFRLIFTLISQKGLTGVSIILIWVRVFATFSGHSEDFLIETQLSIAQYPTGKLLFMGNRKQTYCLEFIVQMLRLPGTTLAGNFSLGRRHFWEQFSMLGWLGINFNSTLNDKFLDASGIMLMLLFEVRL